MSVDKFEEKKNYFRVDILLAEIHHSSIWYCMLHCYLTNYV